MPKNSNKLMDPRSLAILIAAILIGAAAGLLTYAMNQSPAGAVLAALAAAGAALPVLNDLVGSGDGDLR